MGSGPKDGPVGLAPDTRFTTTSRRTAPFTNSRRTVLVPPRGSLMTDAAAALATHQRSAVDVGVGMLLPSLPGPLVAVLAIDLFEPSVNRNEPRTTSRPVRRPRRRRGRPGALSTNADNVPAGTTGCVLEWCCPQEHRGRTQAAGLSPGRGDCQRGARDRDVWPWCTELSS